MMKLKTNFTSIAIFCALAVSGFACNIPVFRYALERWRTDRLNMIVFHSGQLSEPQRRQLASFESGSSLEAGALSDPGVKGNANLQVTLVDIATDASSPHVATWNRLNQGGQLPLPYVVVEGKHIRGSFFCWKGPLEKTGTDLVNSPVRQELARRLLSGDAIVWLVVGSRQATENLELLQMLEQQTKKLSQTVQLPEGIGLPGSELFSEVPLLLKYSVLEIQRDDPREQFMLSLFEGFQPEAFAAGQPLIVPVFGRGRALEVIPAKQLSESLVTDLTQFLCAACSCQVKEQNPGFDLLLDVDWELNLFGEGGEQPPAASADGLGQQRNPVLLSIPPGRDRQ